MQLPAVDSLKNIRGRRVIVRVDFNVPLARSSVHSRQFTVVDDTRIKEAVPTIKWLMKKGAKVILMTHFGHPAAGRESQSLNHKFRIAVERLEEFIGSKVLMAEKWNFKEIEDKVANMRAGDILILPNVRLHPGERKNDKKFAQHLAGLADIYVNEAFPECHRKYASMVGVPKILPAYAGLRLILETETLSRLFNAPQRPMVVLMGGGKITDKIAMMKAMAKRANNVLIGGALANHFFKAAGAEVGASLLEKKGVAIAGALLKNKKLVLPRDVVVAHSKQPNGKVDIVEVNIKDLQDVRTPKASKVICQKPYAILDIGPRAILEFAEYIKNAKTLIWNGPMGLYEIKQYSHATMALGRLFAARSKGRAFGVAGGGETIDALKATGMKDYVDFISTGGGAMLEFLSGKKLPGIEVLTKIKNHRI